MFTQWWAFRFPEYLIRSAAPASFFHVSAVRSAPNALVAKASVALTVPSHGGLGVHVLEPTFPPRPVCRIPRLNGIPRCMMCLGGKRRTTKIPAGENSRRLWLQIVWYRPRVGLEVESSGECLGNVTPNPTNRFAASFVVVNWSFRMLTGIVIDVKASNMFNFEAGVVFNSTEMRCRK